MLLYSRINSELRIYYMSIVELGRFPDQDCLITSLHDRAEELKGNVGSGKPYRAAKNALTAIGERIKQDPTMSMVTTEQSKAFKLSDSHHEGWYCLPYDFNRTGRETLGVHLSASDVQTKEQSYILSALPRTLEEANAYWNEILKKDVRVLVSLHPSNHQIKHWCNGFWTEELIKKMNFSDGWTVTVKDTAVLSRDETEEGPEQGSKSLVVPQLILTTYEAKQDNEIRQLYHLHFDGWDDQEMIPSLKIFCELITTMESISPSRQSPFAINCAAGVSRTGALCTVFDMLKECERRKEKGEPVKAMMVNFAERIFALRHQREGVVAKNYHYSQMHEALYLLLKERGFF